MFRELQCPPLPLYLAIQGECQAAQPWVVACPVGIPALGRLRASRRKGTWVHAHLGSEPGGAQCPKLGSKARTRQKLQRQAEVVEISRFRQGPLIINAALSPCTWDLWV